MGRTLAVSSARSWNWLHCLCPCACPPQEVIKQQAEDCKAARASPGQKTLANAAREVPFTFRNGLGSDSSPNSKTQHCDDEVGQDSDVRILLMLGSPLQRVGACRRLTSRAYTDSNLLLQLQRRDIIHAATALVGSGSGPCAQCSLDFLFTLLRRASPTQCPSVHNASWRQVLSECLPSMTATALASIQTSQPLPTVVSALRLLSRLLRLPGGPACAQEHGACEVFINILHHFPCPVVARCALVCVYYLGADDPARKTDLLNKGLLPTIMPLCCARNQDSLQETLQVVKMLSSCGACAEALKGAGAMKALRGVLLHSPGPCQELAEKALDRMAAVLTPTLDDSPRALHGQNKLQPSRQWRAAKPLPSNRLDTPSDKHATIPSSPPHSSSYTISTHQTPSHTCCHTTRISIISLPDITTDIEENTPAAATASRQLPPSVTHAVQLPSAPAAQAPAVPCQLPVPDTSTTTPLTRTAPALPHCSRTTDGSQHGAVTSTEHSPEDSLESDTWWLPLPPRICSMLYSRSVNPVVTSTSTEQSQEDSLESDTWWLPLPPRVCSILYSDSISAGATAAHPGYAAAGRSSADVGRRCITATSPRHTKQRATRPTPRVLTPGHSLPLAACRVPAGYQSADALCATLCTSLSDDGAKLAEADAQ